jgi:membrane associated rhomboid family serine protease
MIPLRDNIPSRTRPWINYALIFVNVIIFLYELALLNTGLLEKFILRWGFVPSVFLSNPLAEIPTLFSAMFLHGGLTHLGGNMLYLWIFGDNVEDWYGHWRYLIFYLLCGLAASFGQMITSTHSKMPMIGASGAIAGVLGSYFLLYPNARVLALIPFGFFLRMVEIPAFFFLGFWFLLQMFSGTLTLGSQSGGVAWWAHIGGFLAGVGFLFLFRRRRRTADYTD